MHKNTHRKGEQKETAGTEKKPWNYFIALGFVFCPLMSPKRTRTSDVLQAFVNNTRLSLGSQTLFALDKSILREFDGNIFLNIYSLHIKRGQQRKWANEKKKTHRESFLSLETNGHDIFIFSLLHRRKLNIFTVKNEFTNKSTLFSCFNSYYRFEWQQ